MVIVFLFSSSLKKNIKKYVFVFVVWFGFLVPLNGIKKYLALPDKINRNGGLLTNLMVNTPWNHNNQDYSLQQINNGSELSDSKSFVI